MAGVASLATVSRYRYLQGELRTGSSPPLSSLRPQGKVHHHAYCKPISFAITWIFLKERVKEVTTMPCTGLRSQTCAKCADIVVPEARGVNFLKLGRAGYCK